MRTIQQGLSSTNIQLEPTCPPTTIVRWIQLQQSSEIMNTINRYSVKLQEEEETEFNYGNDTTKIEPSDWTYYKTDSTRLSTDASEPKDWNMELSQIYRLYNLQHPSLHKDEVPTQWYFEHIDRLIWHSATQILGDILQCQEQVIDLMLHPVAPKKSLLITKHTYQQQVTGHPLNILTHLTTHLVPMVATAIMASNTNDKIYCSNIALTNEISQLQLLPQYAPPTIGTAIIFCCNHLGVHIQPSPNINHDFSSFALCLDSHNMPTIHTTLLHPSEQDPVQDNPVT
jgi:hypothetical protein